jgi:hypothetical protein
MSSFPLCGAFGVPELFFWGSVVGKGFASCAENEAENVDFLEYSSFNSSEVVILNSECNCTSCTHVATFCTASKSQECY